MKKTLVCVSLGIALSSCGIRSGVDITCDGKFSRTEHNKDETEADLLFRERIVIDPSLDIGSIQNYDLKAQKWDPPDAVTFDESPMDFRVHNEFNAGGTRFRYVYQIDKESPRYPVVIYEEYDPRGWWRKEKSVAETDYYRCQSNWSWF